MDNENMVRIQFELPESRVKELEEMMRLGDIQTRKDLLNNALTLLQWAMKETQAGRIVGSIDEANRRYKELVMPILASAAGARADDSFFKRD